MITKCRCEMPIPSYEAVKKVISMNPRSLLDVGSGSGKHAALFREAGIDVTTLDINGEADITVQDFARERPMGKGSKYQCVWASHVLEHHPNTREFLEAVQAFCSPGGIIAITVPPRKDSLVGGHVNLFTPLSLVYNMILSGIDCSKASILVYGYNISVIVRNNKADLSNIDLHFDRGDIEKLAEFFPVPVKQNTDGFKYMEVNWKC